MKANTAPQSAGNNNSDLDLAWYAGVVTDANAPACLPSADPTLHAAASPVVRRASSRIKKPLSQLVRINGDLVDLASPDSDDFDIHYHASFEGEDELPPTFPHRNSLKRRSGNDAGDGDGVGHQSMASIAKGVKNMLHFKKRSFHSHSDSDSSESEPEIPVTCDK